MWSAVVAQGHTAVFQHKVEALLDGEEVYTRAATVEVSRINSESLLVLASRDDQDVSALLVRLGRIISKLDEYHTLTGTFQNKTGSLNG